MGGAAGAYSGLHSRSASSEDSEEDGDAVGPRGGGEAGGGSVLLLLCKGADEALFPRLAAGCDSEWAVRARMRMRVLLLCGLTTDVCVFVCGGGEGRGPLHCAARCFDLSGVWLDGGGGGYQASWQPLPVPSLTPKRLSLLTPSD